MTDVENDVWETIKLSRYSKHNSFDKYGPVYPYSNENLDKLLYNNNIAVLNAVIPLKANVLISLIPQVEGFAACT